MEFVLILLIITLLAALTVLIKNKIKNEPLTRLIIIKTLLLSFLVISVGIGSIWAFVGHAFMSSMVAESIGWATGSPFQQEVAFANLAIGVLGILCYFYRDNFWTATVIVSSIFLFGAAYVHLINLINYSNHSAGNAGTIFFMDIIGPVILIILLIVYKLFERKQID